MIESIDNLRGNDDQDIFESLDDMTNDHKIKLAVNSEGGSKIDSIWGPSQCLYGCGKQGIPILPVIFSQKSYNLNAKDERYFNHSLAEKSQSNTALASLPTQVYLYVYFKYLSGIEYIREYYTGNDGSFKEITIYDKEDLEEDSSSKRESIIDESISQPINCTKPQHSTIATKYICLSQEYDVAFLKVSHARLSVTVLKKYIQDENFRKNGMQKFVMADQVKNINTIFMSNDEKEYINSFNRRKELAKGNDIDSKIIVSEQSSYASKKNTLLPSKTSVSQDYVRDSYIFAKSSQQAAKLLYERMHYSIKDSIEDIQKADYILASNPKDISTLVNAKPMMVALPDPVGEVLAAAEKRNYLISQLSEISEDKDYSRKLINALIIKNLEKSSIKTTEFKGKEAFNWGDKDVLGTALNIVFSDTDPDDLIYLHINKNNYQYYLQASKKIIDLKNQIVSARQAFIKAITSDDFKFILENDFDVELTHDEETAKGFEAMIARCIAGCGTDDSNLGLPQSILNAFAKSAPKGNDIADEEFQKVLLPQFSQSIEINQNWLLKALGGLDKDLVQKLYDFSKQDRGTEAAGAGIGYLSEQISAGELESIKVNSERSAAANKNALVKTLSQNLIKLYHHDPKAFKNLHLTLQASIYGHTGIKIVPRRVIASMDTMSAFANYALGIAVPKRVKDAINARARKVKTGVINTYEGMSGNTVTRLPNIDTPAQAQIYILNHIDEAKRSNKSVSSLEPLNNGIPINLDALDAEQLAAEARQWRGKSANVAAGGFSIFITFFQLKSVVGSLPFLSKLKYAGDSLLLTEAQLGTASTSLAIVTASMDTTAAGASIIGRTSFASKLIYGAGWIGVVGAVLEVGSLAIYGYRKLNDGNKLSFGLTVGSGVSVSASAAAGLVYGIGVASATTGGAAAIPGAVLLSIMMIGLSLSYSFQRLAYKYDDKRNVLIEYWLDNSVFGNKAMRTKDYSLINPFQSRPAFNSLAEDISGFITACSGFFTKSALSKNHGRTNGILGGAVAGIHGIKFNSQVVMGQFIDSSELHISIELVTKDGKVLSNLFNMSLSSANGSLQPTGNGAYFDHSKVVIESKNSGTVVTVKDIYIKDSVYSADSIQNGRVIIKYIADATQNPVYPLYDFAYMDNNKY